MGAYKQILYQIVFGTKYRNPAIPPECDTELYKYISGIVDSKRCKLYHINGMEDHIHIVSDLHSTVSLADYVKDIKVASNLWMKSSGMFPLFEEWQVGYGAFTYSIKQKSAVIDYVKNQKLHHLSETFYDEYIRLMIENEIEFDERYLFL